MAIHNYWGETERQGGKIIETELCSQLLFICVLSLGYSKALDAALVKSLLYIVVCLCSPLDAR